MTVGFNINPYYYDGQSLLYIYRYTINLPIMKREETPRTPPLHPHKYTTENDAIYNYYFKS